MNLRHKWLHQVIDESGRARTVGAVNGVRSIAHQIRIDEDLAIRVLSHPPSTQDRNSQARGGVPIQLRGRLVELDDGRPGVLGGVSELHHLVVFGGNSLASRSLGPKSDAHVRCQSALEYGSQLV